MLECKQGKYKYITDGIDCETNPMQGLINNVKKEIKKEYLQDNTPLRVVCITDGAKKIRTDLFSIFTSVIIILDWYHLRKKIRELLSMIAINKADKYKHSIFIRTHC